MYRFVETILVKKCKPIYLYFIFFNSFDFKWIQLSISQNLKVNGAVIVSTPQDIALLDARRAIEMFKKVKVNILGLVQNMSSFSCANCGHVDHIFGEGGAKQLANQVGCDYLGDVVLNTEIRRCSDAGQPISILNESHPGSRAYKSICEKIIANY